MSQFKWAEEIINRLVDKQIHILELWKQIKIWWSNFYHLITQKNSKDRLKKWVREKKKNIHNNVQFYTEYGLSNGSDDQQLDALIFVITDAELNLKLCFFSE